MQVTGQTNGQTNGQNNAGEESSAHFRCAEPGSELCRGAIAHRPAEWRRLQRVAQRARQSANQSSSRQQVHAGKRPSSAGRESRWRANFHRSVPNERVHIVALRLITRRSADVAARNWRRSLTWPRPLLPLVISLLTYFPVRMLKYSSQGIGKLVDSSAFFWPSQAKQQQQQQRLGNNNICYAICRRARIQRCAQIAVKANWMRPLEATSYITTSQLM